MLPLIALVGRPNVGKSSLLNALARRRISIVDPVPGVTRDRVTVDLQTPEGRAFELMDTGGIGIVDRDDLGDHVEEQIQIALAAADLVLFVVDVRTGPHALDRRVAEELRRRELPVVVLANKSDSDHWDSQKAEFYKLGFETVLAVSAETRRGLDELYERLEAALARPELKQRLAPAGTALRLAIVGKRNAGKSTLVNQLADAPRVIVSETPGATRDAVDVRFTYRDQTFIAIDTAGIRRTRAVQNSLEFYAQARAIGAIRRADVVLLLIDARVPIGTIEKKLADGIIGRARPCIVGINKWDLAGAMRTDEFASYVHTKLPMLRFAPLAFLSATTGSNLWQTVALASELHAQAGVRVPTGVLNRALRAAVDRRRPPRAPRGTPKLFYGTQVDVHPPTIVLFVNQPGWFPDNYRRYLANQLRRTLPYGEVPLRLAFRPREKVRLDEA